MTKTEFWLARDRSGPTNLFDKEPKWIASQDRYNLGVGYLGDGGHINEGVEKMFFKAGEKIKILRTVTDEGKVTFERAD